MPLRTPWNTTRRRRRSKSDPVANLLQTVVVACTALAVVVILEPWREASGGRQAEAAVWSQADIVGPAQVIDGDTIEIDGRRIRLHGIDAFERDQRCGTLACGRDASAALRGLADGRTTACQVRDVDRYGRELAVCRVGTTDINGWMVRQGHAVAYRRYSGAYVADEDRARRSRIGAWSQEFIDPEAHRRL